MKQTINLEQTYPYSQQEVWHAITDTGALAEWLMPSTNLAIKEGQAFEFHMNMPGHDGNVRCKILTVDKPRKLAYSWQWSPESSPTVVTWFLESAGNGTKLRLEHSGFDSEKDAQLYGALTGGWTKKLEELLPKTLAGQKATA